MRIFTILIIIILSSCGGTRYVPDGTVLVKREVPKREPTDHEKRTYEIYKSNPKKLNRWLKDLEKRGH